VLHVVCGPKAKLRPTVQIQSSYFYVTYSVTIPAKKTVVLCYFESQANSMAEHTKTMKNFKVSNLLKDLPGSVRKLILNFRVRGSFGDVDLERSETGDTILLTGGDPIRGKIQNPNFTVETFFGKITLPAKQVIGMVTEPEQQILRFVLVDGQIVTGKAENLTLNVSLASGSKLKVPLRRVRQCSYQITKAKPDEPTSTGPIAILRTGDRLAFDPTKLKLNLRTKYGTASLDASRLLQIYMDNPGNAIHLVKFLHGSQLGGFLEPETIEMSLKLGSKLNVPRNMLVQMIFTEEEKSDPSLTRLTVTNGDILYGRLVDKVLKLKTEFSDGMVDVSPGNLRAMAFCPTHLGRAAIQMWDNTVLRGEISPDVLSFQVENGPTLKVPVNQIVNILRSQATPPEKLTKKVQQLVAQLGAESHKDRETATKALEEMPPTIVPLLQKHKKNSDPEVRHRLQQIIEKLGGGKPQGGKNGKVPVLFPVSVSG